MARRPQNPRSRVIIEIGGRRLVSQGLLRHFWDDLYHYALTVRWSVFFALAGTAFVTLNLTFATIYTLGSDPIANQTPAGFLGAFFFSVETLSTVGYGDMHPQTMYAHLIATTEIFTGMGFIAVMTGLVFSRFSRPRAKILFVDHPVVLTLDGKPTLMIRAANTRQNVISSAWAQLHLLKRHTSPEGYEIPQLVDLPLVRDHHPSFMLTWDLMHTIDEASPMHGETPESLAGCEALFALSIQGIDQTTAQNMYARQQWSHEDLRWNCRYLDLFESTADGNYVIDYSRFQGVVALDDGDPSSLKAARRPPCEGMPAG